jgi:hypothetical protein
VRTKLFGHPHTFAQPWFRRWIEHEDRVVIVPRKDLRTHAEAAAVGVTQVLVDRNSPRRDSFRGRSDRQTRGLMIAKHAGRRRPFHFAAARQ